MGIETDVMEAAAALKLAVDRAQAAGYHVNWPLRASEIGSIAVSATARVANLDGSPLVYGDDGLIHGEPMIGLTDEERAALPRLNPDASNDPADFVLVEGVRPRKPRT